MSLENRLAGPIIFARERSLNYFEQRAREEEKTARNNHLFHAVVLPLYVVCPTLTRLFLNPLFAGKKGGRLRDRKMIFFFLHRKCCKIILLVVKRVVIGDSGE